jgi:hypothetical protein
VCASVHQPVATAVPHSETTRTCWWTLSHRFCALARVQLADASSADQYTSQTPIRDAVADKRRPHISLKYRAYKADSTMIKFYKGGWRAY